MRQGRPICAIADAAYKKDKYVLQKFTFLVRKEYRKKLLIAIKMPEKWR